MEKTDFDVEKAETAIVVVDKLEEISTNSRERHNTISKSLQEIINLKYLPIFAEPGLLNSHPSTSLC